MWPGRWRNPDRYGLGWDFFYGDGENTMYLTWFTFDSAGRPIWLHGGDATPLVFNAVTGERTWQGRLFEVHWNMANGRSATPVGAVSVTFPRETTTRAAVRWAWQDVDTAAHNTATYDECLYDKRDPTTAGRGTTPTLSEAFSSNWFYDGPDDDPLIGWGVDFLIEVGHGGAADPDYVETATAAIFDTGTRAVWLQSVDDWLSDAPSQSTFGLTNRGFMRYAQHAAATPHPATAPCSSQSCVLVKYDDHGTTGNDNRFFRDLPSGRRGTMSLHATVPNTATGGSPIQWPPPGGLHPFPDPVPVFRFDGNHIMVDRSVCRVAHREDRCNFIVSWVADEPAGTTISRVDLRSHTYSAIPQNDDHQFVDSLGVDDRVQYQIEYHSSIAGDGKLLTPEVRVLVDGQIADQNLDPVACESGPSCDLGSHDPTVGAIAGEAGTEGGAANYSIPFTLPPGRSGMLPSLALTYSSRAGDGLAGMGWSLSGLSSIYRCPRTVDQDGAGHAAAVQMDASDALCLDGQRLVPMGSGTYGTSGATYRTEIDSFSRVTQVGSLVGNSACFRVEEKSGRIAHYGAVANGASCGTSNNARTLPGNASNTLGWLLQEVDDRVGNNILYSYGVFGAGENLLQRISYTGYQGQAGNRVVQIGYAPRPDSDRSSSYMAGGLTQQTQRLISVQAFADGQPGMTYQLSYLDVGLQTDVSAYSGRSLLQQVTQCAPGGQCLPPTKIDWNNLPEDTVLHPLSIPAIPASVPDANSGLDRGIFPVGDVDGDGVREMLVTQNEGTSQRHAYLVKQSADRATTSALEVTAIFAPFYFSKDLQTDFDGDGKVDLLGVSADSVSKYVVWRWGAPRGAALAAGVFVPAPTTNVPVATQILSTDDVDGDGRPDLLTYLPNSNCDGTNDAANSRICFYKNTSSVDPATGARRVSFAAGVAVKQWLQSDFNQPRTVGDFNGDGVRDIIMVSVGSQYDGSYINSVLMSVSGSGANLPAACTATLSSYFKSCSAASMNLSQSSYGYNSLGAAVFWQDINGDGLTDLLFATQPETGCADGPTGLRSPPSVPGTTPVETGNWCLKLSTGRGFTAIQSVEDNTRALLAASDGGLRYANRLPIADIDGDGRPNILFPVALAARRCEAVQVNFAPRAGSCAYPPEGQDTASRPDATADTCRVNVWMCANDPTSNMKDGSGGKYDLPDISELDGSLAPYVENAYSPIIHIDRRGTDRSAYVMASVRFVQTASGYRAETVNLDQSGSSQNPNQRIAHKVVMTLADPGANNLADDLYGDGLVDLVSRVGCYGQGVQTGKCAFVGSETSGPSTLKVTSAGVTSDIPMSQLSAGQVTLINENLGISERPGYAPRLPELVSTISDGLGRTSTWDYYPLSSNAGRGANEPLYFLPANEATYADNRHFYFRSSMPVVSTLVQSNGIGATTGFRSWQYGYGEAIYNRFGRGFQGFRTIVKDSLLGKTLRSLALRTRTDFYQKFPLTGKVQSMVTGVQSTALGVTAVSEEIYDWGCAVDSPGTPCDTVNGAAPVNFPFVKQKTVKTYDLTQAEAGVLAPVSSVIAVDTWDRYGNMKSEETTSADLYSQSGEYGPFVTSSVSRIDKTYSSFVGSDWWLDRLDTSTLSNSGVQYNAAQHALPSGYVAPNPATQKVKTVYQWDAATHLATSVEVQPADTVSGDAFDQQHSLMTYAYPTPNYGLPRTVTVTGSHLTGTTGSATESRTTVSESSTSDSSSIDYTSPGYFVLSKTDPAGIVTTQAVRPVDGQVVTSKDGLGSVTTNTFDVFGRVIQVDKQDSTHALVQQPIRIAWRACSNGSCDGNGVGETGTNTADAGNERFAAYRVTTAQNGSPTQVMWYDQLGRPVKQAKRGFDSTFIVTDTSYTALGAVLRQSAPFFINAPAAYGTQYTYDRLGRMKSKYGMGAELDATHGDVYTTYTYVGNRTEINVRPTAVNCTGYVGNLCMNLKRYQSVLGLARTVDAANGVTRFWYDTAGHAVAIADANTPAGVTSTQAMIATYDALGRRTRLVDPNQGTWSFSYNPAGELLSQVDGRGWTTTVDRRDSDGRPLLQTAESYTALTTTGGPANKIFLKDEWQYDASRAALLAKQQRSTYSNPANPIPAWTETYAYDAAGRALGITSNVDGIDRATSFQYDANYGREKAVEYPSGLIVQTKYQKYGHVLDMLDGKTGERFWGIGNQDAWGNPTQEFYGNGLKGEYTWTASTGQSVSRQWRGMESDSSPIQDRIAYTYDSLGNLTAQTRQNGSSGNMAESYAYDNLQRLTTAQPPVGSNGQQPPAVRYSYDALGNLTSKSDFSSTAANAYLYQVPAGDTTTYTKRCGPNVAQQITLDNGSPVYFHCDANGNLIHNSGQSSFAERKTVYDATNRPSSITAGAYSGTFTYATTGDRVKEILYENLPNTQTPRITTLVRGPRGYEQESVSGANTVTLRHEIGDVSVVIMRTVSGTGPVLPGDQLDVYYKHNDRLGSPLGVTDRGRNFAVRDGAIGTPSRRSFDAFGKTRNADFTARSPVGALGLTAATREGFTGHEHLDSLGVIHMNGRIYDYRVGRFLGVDPAIQSPSHSQSLNPYSYIMNNPLGGRDPSGYTAVGEDCGGNMICRALADSEFVGGPTRKLRNSLSLGGAPEGRGPEENGTDDYGPKLKHLVGAVEIGKISEAQLDLLQLSSSVRHKISEYVDLQKKRLEEATKKIKFTGNEESIGIVKSNLSKFSRSPRAIDVLNDAIQRWKGLEIEANPGSAYGSTSLKGKINVYTDEGDVYQQVLVGDSDEMDRFVSRGLTIQGKQYALVTVLDTLLHEILHSAYDDFGLGSNIANSSDDIFIIKAQNTIMPELKSPSFPMVGHRDWIGADELKANRDQEPQ